MWKSRGLQAAVFYLGFIAVAAAQQPATVSLRVKNHQFEPKEITAPANVPIVLHLQNLDSTPMEFESVSLRVEKTVVGNGQGVIRIRPLAAGRYEFFDDFHQQTTGVLIVR